MNSLLTITHVLWIRAIIEIVSSLITIFLNILFIIAIVRLKNLRTHQNIFLINFILNLMCLSFAVLASVIIALEYSISHSVNMQLCRIIAFLVYGFCHGIMYSYLLLSINRFMNAFHRSKKHHSSIKCILFEVILQWLLASLVPSIPLILNQIEFQTKPRFCSARKPFYMTLGIFTGFVLPVVFITAFNLYIYCYLNKLHANISRHFYNRQNYKNEKLLRQFAAFSTVFIIGWGLFAFISVFDINDTVHETIYLITLSLPSISLVIITLMIINWNKAVKQSILNLLDIRSRREYPRSATTIQFSAHGVGFNYN